MQLEERTTGMDLWALPQFGERKPIVVANTTFNEGSGKFSPDVKWVVYESDESGRPEVYIQSFPVPDIKRPITNSGGITPRWSRDGKELFYMSPDNELMKIRIIQSEGQKLETSAPERLFPTRIAVGGTRAGEKQQYDISRDGQRFLINLDESSTAPITIVTNWTQALKK
jgi:eukaryotic-like serine/threonine-protein kinase